MKKPVKQVIIVRKDLNMRKGKLVAQGSHASMAVLTRRIHSSRNEGGVIDVEMSVTPAMLQWMENSFTKICLYVNSEKELDEVYLKAKEAGLPSEMIVDSGKTEFNNIPTKTCIAIGPAYSEDIDKVTSHLRLL